MHRFAKSWRGERARVPAQAFVPMSFSPGDAYQFDWSHETITLRGLPLTVKAAHMKLSQRLTNSAGGKAKGSADLRISAKASRPNPAKYW